MPALENVPRYRPPDLTIRHGLNTKHQLESNHDVSMVLCRGVHLRQCHKVVNELRIREATAESEQPDCRSLPRPSWQSSSIPFYAWFAIGFLWPDFLLNDLVDNSVADQHMSILNDTVNNSQADRRMSILIIASGTLIWGYLVPKVMFSLRRTKPLGADKPDQTPAIH